MTIKTLFPERWLTNEHVANDEIAALPVKTISSQDAAKARLQRVEDIVDAIKGQAAAAGWTAAQLDELRQTLNKIPADKVAIGQIRRESIEINLYSADGSCRGALTFYNMAIEQPWMKRV